MRVRKNDTGQAEKRAQLGNGEIDTGEYEDRKASL